MFLLMLAALLIQAAAPEAGQSGPDCTLLMLQPQQDLVAIDHSTTVGNFGECAWPNPGIPLGYRVQRSLYTVHLRVFQNNSGGVALNAIDAAGNPIRLRGEMFMDAVEMKIPLKFDRADYRYWVLPSWLNSRPISFEVLNGNDLVIGREQLIYKEVHPRHK